MYRSPLLLLLCFYHTAALPQAGQPDNSFGNGGIVYSNLYHAGGASGGVKTFLQADGSYRVLLREGGLVYLSKLLANGSGLQVLPLVFIYQEVENTVQAAMKYGDAATLTDGSIVLAGSESSNGNEDFRVIITS